MRRAGLRQRLTFAVVATVLALVALEVTARVLFQGVLAAVEAPPKSPQYGAPTMRGNPYLLWEHAPGVRLERGVPATINSMGLRGAEPVIPTPDGVRRILVTGDSSVYGFGVGDDETFVQVTAQELGVEGWNAAIPGYSTFQTLNLLEMRAWALEPDVLVIGNLWSDNNFDAFVDRDLLSAYSSFEGSGAQGLHRLLRPLAFYRVLHYRLRVMDGEQAEARNVGWQLGSKEQVGVRRVEINDYATNLDRLAEMALSEGRQVVFVMLANREDVEGRTEGAWSVYRGAMQDIATRHGAPVVDVPSLFRDSARPSQELFLDEMHPTTQGHALIGHALAEVLEPWRDGDTVMTEGTGAPIALYDDPFIRAPEPGG
ncbi:MAG TPA: GDSL-type esterase/lipase family protein [Myxococcota bacterium]|nr:GDSL-type esterase/lipase family protein [Myxococcota bacterium]